MSLLTHGGRIVPILTGHQQQHPDSTPESSVLDTTSPTYPKPSSLLDQPEDAPIMRQPKAIDLASLEMPCLRERGLFALPTQGDGKTHHSHDLEALPHEVQASRLNKCCF